MTINQERIMLAAETKLISVVVTLVAATGALGQIQITRSAFGAGGGTLAGGSLVLSTTVGQTLAGPTAAPPFIVDAGFWVPAPDAVPPCPADFNGDGLRNPDDLSELITCFFLELQFPGFCPPGDFNGDGLINPDDLSEFITVFFLGC
jgi:hypothetical protein